MSFIEWLCEMKIRLLQHTTTAKNALIQHPQMAVPIQFCIFRLFHKKTLK